MLIVSCTGNKGYDQLLAKADSLMNVDDDSAKVAIQLLDDVKPELTEFTWSQVMRYELLYHKAMNKATEQADTTAMDCDYAGFFG